MGVQNQLSIEKAIYPIPFLTIHTMTNGHKSIIKMLFLPILCLLHSGASSCMLVNDRTLNNYLTYFSIPLSCFPLNQDV